MNPAELDLQAALALSASLNPDPHLTQRTSDYLAGRMLGPREVVIVQSKTEVPGALADEESAELGQSVRYWAGPLLPAGHARRAEQIRSLKKAFAPRNLILEGCERLADAITADEAGWSFTLTRPLKNGEQPTADEATLIAEAEAMATEWWDRRKIHLLMQRWVPELIAHGRGVLRPVLAASARNEDGTLKAQADPVKAALNLHIKAADPLTSGIVEDPDTLEQIGVTALDFWDAERRYQQEAELTWIGEDGKTYLRIITGNRERQQSRQAGLDLGGHLLLLQAELRRPAVTEDVIRQNDQANVAYTLMGKNTHFAGYVERFGIGIDPPEKLNVGPETANFFQPSVITETETRPDGVKIVRESPMPGARYEKFDPADPKALNASIDVFERNVFSLLRQAFTLHATGSNASGRSQEVATGDYAVAVKRLRGAVEAILRDLLGLLLRLVALQLGQPERYAGLRPVVSLTAFTFPPSPEERSQNREDVKAGLLSYQTGRARAGVADPDAEARQIAKEQQEAANALPQPT